MKKICHIGPGQPVHHMRIFHRFCWSMAEAGHQVELIAHDEGDAQDCGAILIHDLGPLGSSTLHWKLGSRLARNFKACLLAFRTRADLYFFYSPEFIPFGLLLKWISGKPVVFDCMEDFVSYALQRQGIPNALRNTFAYSIGRTFRFAAQHLDFITVADYGTEGQFQKHTSNTVTIFNFPRKDIFPPLPRNPIGNYDFDLVYHGSNLRCYLEVLLAVDQQLLRLGKPVTWYLFGTFEDLDWLQSELDRLNAKARFYISGRIPHDRVFSEVQRARIGIIPLPALPKYLNNIPQKFFEYMALGLPTVLSDLPPNRPFVVGNNVAIMVDPNDPIAYAKAIIKLLDDPELCQAMGRQGRQLVEQLYNWETESKKLITLVNTLTEHKTTSDQAPFITDAD
jgi:glycosyltransferase involved in cell wall biosynthesis